MQVGVDFALKVLELDDVNVHLQLWCVHENFEACFLAILRFFLALRHV